jgi:hypothetical protein
VTRFFNCEIVAVRWKCRCCEATAVGAPHALPTGWAEFPPPPWQGDGGPFYACPSHADEQLVLSRRQWDRFDQRTHVVSVAEYESVRVSLREALSRLDRLKLSGERTASRKL